MGPITYCEQNVLMDAQFPKGALNYWKSDFLTALSDDAIDTAVECYARVTSPMSQIFFEHLHGKAASVPAAATAFPHRREGFNFGIFAQWADAVDTKLEVQWARESHAVMSRFCRTGRYINYQSDEGLDVVAAAYGANYARLCEVKARYDPQNVFHLNQNIAPMAGHLSTHS
jgi:FAD/FMN-containing dehydrogenase